MAPSGSSTSKIETVEVEVSWLRRLGLIALAIGLIAALIGGIGALHYRAYLRAPVVADGRVMTVVIPHDTAWPQVVELLADQGVVTNPRYFDVWARSVGLPADVKAGTYIFEGPIMLPDLDTRLREGGAVEDVEMTIPEGYTIFHIADRVDAIGLANRDAFLDAARDGALLAELDVPGESFEGYLFPDTYRFRQGATPTEIIGKMHARFEQVWGELRQQHPEALDALATDHALRMHDVVILASIIERETNYDPERDVIARVFLNRLERDIRLQTDPTCVYGEETYREVPHPRFCKDKLNRYSTYVIDGFPPGPISNPGRASLAAALTPATSEASASYIFFCAKRDGSGAHHFSATYKEHLRAVKKFLK